MACLESLPLGHLLRFSHLLRRCGVHAQSTFSLLQDFKSLALAFLSKLQEITFADQS
jgi:hypothetical protein